MVLGEPHPHTLLLQPGEYNIVACHDKYEAAFNEISTVHNAEYTVHFDLAPAPTGTVTGGIAVMNGTKDQHVALSFRRNVSSHGGQEEEIEVKSIQVANLSDYHLVLTEGFYQVVASPCGKASQEHFVEINAGTDTSLDMVFY